MKTPSILALALCLLAAFAHAVPTVTNIVAVQRAGTKLVDVTFDVADTGASVVTISMDVSSDGGATFTVPSTTVTGHIGAGVAVGTGKTFTWNAGVDWGNQFSTMVRFRIYANDDPAPAGFVRIPAGTFSMGDALDGLADAAVHQVTLSSFYMQKTETTKGDWDTVKTWALANGYTFTNAGAGSGTSYPVQTMSWYDAVKWCNAKSVMEGLTPCYYTDTAQTVATVYKTGDVNITNAMVKWNSGGYRLPTEAEWEYAARGGLSAKRFPWGDTITHSQAVYQSSASYAYDISLTRGGHPTYGNVSSAGAVLGSVNGYGLYDMSGNVWEWCWDWYDGGYYGGLAATNPRGPSVAGSNRVIRGGAGDTNANNVRCANRNYYGPARSALSIGFRPARGVLQ